METTTISWLKENEIISSLGEKYYHQFFEDSAPLTLQELYNKTPELNLIVKYLLNEAFGKENKTRAVLFLCWFLEEQIKNNKVTDKNILHNISYIKNICESNKNNIEEIKTKRNQTVKQWLEIEELNGKENELTMIYRNIWAIYDTFLGHVYSSSILADIQVKNIDKLWVYSDQEQYFRNKIINEKLFVNNKDEKFCSIFNIDNKKDIYYIEKFNESGFPEYRLQLACDCPNYVKQFDEKK